MEFQGNIWKKRGLFVLLMGYFILGYPSLDAFNQDRGVFYVIGFPFEAKIPFLAPFILGYGLIYLAVFLLYWVVPNWEIFKKMIWAYFWMTTICYLIFFLFPVKMIWRPEIVDPHGPFEWLAQFIFSLDRTYNCFPSLHVAYPTLATVFAWRYIPKWRFFFLALTVITAVSVVLVKQHYILDALAGMGVAMLVGVFRPRICR